jgi:hypothetical protein
MKFKSYLKEDEILNEGAFFQKLLNKIGNKSTNVVKKIFKDNWIKLATIIKANGLENSTLSIINRYLKTNFRSIDQIEKMAIKESVNEDFKHYWNLIKGEGFPALSFYPLLQVFLEVDKLIKNTGEANVKAIVIYGLFWVLLVSGKHLKGWFDWKKANPKEHELEGGKKNPFAV